MGPVYDGGYPAEVKLSCAMNDIPRHNIFRRLDSWT